MRLIKILSLCFYTLVLVRVIDAQHLPRTKIDSLKSALLVAKGVQKIDCLNALSEEYWWPPLFYPDSIAFLSDIALEESKRVHYARGVAYATLHLGVAEVYRKNFLRAEPTLRQALEMFHQLKDETGIGWCNVWLGQALFSQNNFKEAFPLFKQAKTIFSKLKNGEGEGKSWSMLGYIYSASGNYDSSLYCYSQSISVRQKMKDEVCIAATLTSIGHLYETAGARDQALNYYQQSINYSAAHSSNFPATNWKYFMDEPIAMIYILRKMPDSALYYLRNAMNISPHNHILKMTVGEIVLSLNQFDTALQIFSEPIEHFKKENNKLELVRVLLNSAKAYYSKKDYKSALQHVKEALAIAEEGNFKGFMAEGYLLLSKLYNHQNKNDSAFVYSQRYIALKDSITNAQFLWRLADYQRQTEYTRQKDQLFILNNENQLKERQLSQAAQIKWLLIFGLLIAGIASGIVYHNLNLKRRNEKLQNEKKQSELQHHATELKMHALRAQMNPHFIFNCLNSINRFILKNESEEASNYLTKFSRLIRMVLTHSKNSFISLEDEIEMVKLYLDMERLRFKNAFEYNVVFKNSVNAGNIFVPPLLLQPFAENAVWHGMMHKVGNGRLEISFKSHSNDILVCTIADNGIGRQKAAETKNRSGADTRSMGLKITAERLALLNTGNDHSASFKVDDLVDKNGAATGTRVTLNIHYKNLVDLAESTK